MPPSGVDTLTSTKVKNDARVLSYAKSRVAALEKELKIAQTELKILKAKPALATQREEYVLAEVEHSNRQLEGIDSPFAFVIFLQSPPFCLSCLVMCLPAVFVHNAKDEAERVKERLDNATDDPVVGHQH